MNEINLVSKLNALSTWGVNHNGYMATTAAPDDKNYLRRDEVFKIVAEYLAEKK